MFGCYPVVFIHFVSPGLIWILLYSFKMIHVCEYVWVQWKILPKFGYLRISLPCTFFDQTSHIFLPCLFTSECAKKVIWGKDLTWYWSWFLWLLNQLHGAKCRIDQQSLRYCVPNIWSELYTFWNLLIKKIKTTTTIKTLVIFSWRLWMRSPVSRVTC
jgi:hypothetical protein